MDVKIEKIASMKVAAVRHVGPYTDCGSAWEKLGAWATPKGLIGPDTIMLGVCYDDPKTTPPEKIRYDACMSIKGNVETQPPVTKQEIAGGEYATYRHKGPYAGLAAAYEMVYGQWLPQSGRRYKDAPCFEIYRNCPTKTAPEDLITDIYVPLI